jgi:hypothetical protein
VGDWKGGRRGETYRRRREDWREVEFVMLCRAFWFIGWEFITLQTQNKYWYFISKSTGIGLREEKRRGAHRFCTPLAKKLAGTPPPIALFLISVNVFTPPCPPPLPPNNSSPNPPRPVDSRYSVVRFPKAEDEGEVKAAGKIGPPGIIPSPTTTSDRRSTNAPSAAGNIVGIAGKVSFKLLTLLELSHPTPSHAQNRTSLSQGEVRVEKADWADWEEASKRERRAQNWIAFVWAWESAGDKEVEGEGDWGEERMGRQVVQGYVVGEEGALRLY